MLEHLYEKHSQGTNKLQWSNINNNKGQKNVTEGVIVKNTKVIWDMQGKTTLRNIKMKILGQ